MRPDTDQDGSVLAEPDTAVGHAGPDDVGALLARGMALHQRGDPAAALVPYEEALAMQLRLAPADNRQEASLRDAVAGCLLQLERADEALAQRRLILPLVPAGAERVTALNRAGADAFIASRYKEAAAHFSESLDLLRTFPRPDDRTVAATLSDYGTSLSFLGHLDQAERLLREAVALDPELDAAKRMLGHTLSKAGHAEEAAMLTRHLRRRQPVLIMRTPLRAKGTVLTLTSESGNIPSRHLFSRLEVNLINWTTEYADDDPRTMLPPHDLVFNLIGDSDDGEEALARAASYEAICRVPFLNPPSRVQRTRRDLMPALLAGIDGLVVPRVVRREASGNGAPPDRAGLRLPMLLRKAGRHGGDSVELIQTDEQFRTAWPHTGSCYMTEYHDYRSADGYFRKYRVIFVDRQPFPYHLAISPQWLVHYFSADMIDHAWKQAEELTFLADIQRVLGDRAFATLHEVGRRIDLDYGGIDFSVLPDGSLLFFEANATMLVHPEEAEGPLRTKNPFIQRILDAFETSLLRRLPASPDAGRGASLT